MPRYGVIKQIIFGLKWEANSPLSQLDLIGYVRIIDLHLDPSDTVETLRELPTVQADDAHIAALIQLQSTKEELARVVDVDGETIGVLYASELTDPLFREAAI